jgi:hypothetical protein
MPKFKKGECFWMIIYHSNPRVYLDIIDRLSIALYMKLIDMIKQFNTCMRNKSSTDKFTN